MMFDRRILYHFDWLLITLVLLLFSVGLLTLYSVTAIPGSETPRVVFVKQGVWYCLGLLTMVVVVIIDYKDYEKWSYALYVLVIVLLVGILLFGKHVGGARRWFSLGPVSIQPSEFAKLSVIMVLARYYSRILKPDGFCFQELALPFGLSMLPFLLIAKQPDLGTGIVVLLISASISLFVKIEKRTLALLALLSSASLPVIWMLLKDYQRQRILTFLDTERDPLGAGYHIIQSKIAIGSGWLFGKGFLKGTQNVLSFLPERHTDFIFAVLAEEWGFAGSFAICFLFFLLILWGLNIAYHCKDPYGTIISFGVTSLIFWQIFINLGMIMGIMPVVGMPLPLVSYGGSSILTIMICVGILMNVSMRRFRV